MDASNLKAKKSKEIIDENLKCLSEKEKKLVSVSFKHKKKPIPTELEGLAVIIINHILEAAKDLKSP